MADPHVISALRCERAELSGELITAEQRIVRLRAGGFRVGRGAAGGFVISDPYALSNSHSHVFANPCQPPYTNLSVLRVGPG